MKVIFIKDLKKQGKVNDIKEVSDGYATNYLIKNGYAVKYTKTSSNILEETIEKNKMAEELQIKEAKEVKKHLENLVVTFKVKSNNGKVFGSVSSKQIYERLLQEGFKINKKNIKLDNNLSSLGYHDVAIELHKKVIANLKIKISEK